MEISLKNKVIVISGATKGVGKDVAIKASKIGAKIILGGRDSSSAESILCEIQRNDGEAIFVPTDLSKPSDCENLITSAIENYKKIDGFVNYAGITDSSSLLESDSDLIDRMFDINVKAAILCCKYAVKNMIENDGGSIVLVGSPHAWAGEEDRLVYACSKGSILTLSDHISKHYAKFDIRSNIITMGWTPTEGELALREKQGITEDELRIMASKTLPGGKMTEVSDITQSILFLLSDQSKMVSGANFRITGGWFL